MNNVMNNVMKIDVEATHNQTLPLMPPALQRQVNVYDPRPRVGKEKHYLQRATMFLDGTQVDTGYTMVKSYETFELLMLCNNAKVYPHAYKMWDYLGKDHYETDEYQVIDLCTGNVLSHWGYNEETEQLYIADQEPRPDRCTMCNRKETVHCQTVECVVIVEPQKNDLHTCAYSQEMYEKLQQISEQNEPQEMKEFKARHNLSTNPRPNANPTIQTSLEQSQRVDKEIQELMEAIKTKNQVTK